VANTVTDKTVIDACNTRFRPMSDAIVRLRYAADAFMADMTIANTGVQAALQNYEGTSGNSGSDLVADGSGPAGDGRPVMTVTDALLFVNAIQSLQSALASTSPGVPGSGGATIYQIANAIQVNGSPR